MIMIEKISFILLFFGMLCLLAMMVFVDVDIVARYFFNDPVAGSTELVSVLLVVASFSCLALPQFFKRHITITVITDRLNSKTRALINAGTSLLSALFTVVIIWQTFAKGIEEQISNAISPIMSIPQAPFRYLCALVTIFLFLAFVADFINLFSKNEV